MGSGAAVVAAVATFGTMAALVAGASASSETAAATRLVDRAKVGVYLHPLGKPFADPVAEVDLLAMEAQLGRRFDLVHYFFTWGRPFREAITGNVDGRELMLSMKPEGRLVWDIKDGRQDPFIDQFARDAKAWGNPVYIRFGHEMNGDWMSYSAGRAGGPTATDFKAAWVRLVSRFRAVGATNVEFVWSPNESDWPAVAGNRMEDYWPGDAYVDVAGFDGYNWSSQLPRRGDGRWRSFDEVVSGPYERISRFSGRPIWLCEFGTTEAVYGVDPTGASKAAWFRDMFASTAFPRLTGIVYFSENDERDVQRDWRIDSSPESIAGFRSGWATRTTPVVATPTPTESPEATQTPAVAVSSTASPPLPPAFPVPASRT